MLAINLKGLTESCLLPVVVIALGFFLNPDDPLFLHAAYPWVWLIPMLIGLRYGLVNAIFAVAIYTSALFYTVYFGFFDWQSYHLWYLGGIIGTLVGSEYHAYWENKLIAQDARSNYLHKRLESLSRAYSTMRISHDRLEEALVVKPVTLRGALTDLRHCMRAHHGQFNHESATQFMAILANCASLNKAALYLFQGKHLNHEPTAWVGRSENLKESDELVKRCLKERQTIYVAINQLEANEASDYLAVIPFQTADNVLLGVFTVSDLPFIAMTDETLKILSLLLSYVADGSYAEQNAKIITTVYPDCPPFFATELIKCFNLQKKYGINTTLITFHFADNTECVKIESLIRQTARGLDVLWERKGKHRSMNVLMPLSDGNMVEGYLNRIQEMVEKTLGLTMAEPDTRITHHSISAYASLPNLIKAFEADE